MITMTRESIGLVREGFESAVAELGRQLYADILPAAFRSARPVSATVNLDCDGAFCTKLLGDFFFFVSRGRRIRTVELRDLDTIDPGREMRVLSPANHAGGVPVVD